MKAAALDSPEAMVSLSLMLRDGEGGEVDVPLSVFYMSVAAQFGSVRAVIYLARALYDPRSWLGSFSRQQRRLHRDHWLLHNTSLPPPLPPAVANTSSFSSSEISLKNKRLRFDESLPMKVFLPDGTRVALPFPLWAEEGRCEAAIPLLKYLAEMSYRPRDLCREGLEEYLGGRIDKARDLFEEAAHLGYNTTHYLFTWLSCG